MPMYEGFTAASDKQTVILDIGAAYTKLGFSGEFAPRCILRSEIKCKITGKERNVFNFKNGEDLYDMLVEFVHVLYFRHILLSPKDRPLVIVESLLCPTLFRETLAQVLFLHYEISTILVVPSHLVSLSPLAIDTGLVLDVGYSEAVCIPICHGVPVVHAWQALSLASEAVHGNLRRLLEWEDKEMRSEERVLEDIKVRCCFVTTRTRAHQHSSKTVPTTCLPIKYPLGGSKTLTIPGNIRELAYEFFFDEDLDHLSLPSMILDAILRVNVDLRVPLAENIILTGGTCMATGFKARLKDELEARVKTVRYEKLKLLRFKFHAAPSKENYTAWLGGAIYGNTDLLALKGIPREVYLKEKRLPDWVDLRDNRAP